MPFCRFCHALAQFECHETFSKEVTVDEKLLKHIALNHFIRITQGLSYISFCPLRILFNSKFTLLATSLETNAVIVTRVLCIEVLIKIV